MEPVLLVKVRELKNILIIMAVLSRVLLLALLFFVASATLVHAKGKTPAPEEEGDEGDEGDELVAEKGGKKQLEVGEVTYDARSLMINGKRKLFFSGSIHYPRSTVEVSL